MPQRHNSTDDVPGKLARIARTVRETQFLGANNANVIPHPHFTKKWSHQFNHFQGVQRHGNYLLVSGGHKHGSHGGSQLILVEMGSRANQAWSVPNYFDRNAANSYKRPHPDDRIMAMATIDHAKWHGGGCQMMGTRMAIPIYGGGSGSEVRFYDFGGLFAALGGGPMTHSDIRQSIENAPFSKVETKPKVKAVALSCLPNGTPVAVLWDDKDLLFYHESTAGVWEHKGTVDASDIAGFDHLDPLSGVWKRDYQNINLFLDTTQGGRPMFYLLCFHNTSLLNAGKNRADVFKFAPNLDPTRRVVDADPAQDSQGIKRVLRLEMSKAGKQGKQYNFSAAAGAYLARGGSLFIYSTPHWLRKKGARLNFNEYAPN